MFIDKDELDKIGVTDEEKKHLITLLILVKTGQIKEVSLPDDAKVHLKSALAKVIQGGVALPLRVRHTLLQLDVLEPVTDLDKAYMAELKKEQQQEADDDDLLMIDALIERGMKPEELPAVLRESLQRMYDKAKETKGEPTEHVVGLAKQFGLAA